MIARMPFALSIAAAMILLAFSARMGWTDRNAVQTILLVLPIIAATRLLRGNGSCICAETQVEA